MGGGQSRSSRDQPEFASGVKISRGVLEQLAGKRPTPPSPHSYDSLALRPSDVQGELSAKQHQIAEVQAALAKSTKLGDQLVKSTKDEWQRIESLADELMRKEYITPSKEVPCKEEEAACLQCYQTNQEDPLKCSAVVAQYSACARQAYADFVQHTLKANTAAAS